MTQRSHGGWLGRAPGMGWPGWGFLVAPVGTPSWREWRRPLPAPGRFWTLQFVVWPLYGFFLMVPWLGTYSVWVMVPNKAVIAGTGLLASGLLRAAYRAALRREAPLAALLAVVLGGSLLTGLIWNAALTAMLGGWVHQDLARLGTLASGVPQLSGGLYHGLLLLTWSLGYLGFRAYGGAPRPGDGGRAQYVIDPAPAGIEVGSPVPRAPLILRDGKRTVVLDPAEVEWVQAAGDYVRIYLGGRRLVVRMPLSRLEGLLPSGEFIRVHRSTIVRLAQIQEMLPDANGGGEVLLRQGTKLTVSRTFAGPLRQRLGL